MIRLEIEEIQDPSCVMAMLKLQTVAKYETNAIYQNYFTLQDKKIVGVDLTTDFIIHPHHVIAQGSCCGLCIYRRNKGTVNLYGDFIKHRFKPCIENEIKTI